MRTYVVVTALMALLCACSRQPPKNGGGSRIALRAPSSFGKVGAFEAMPTDRKACYGVSITGAGVPNIPADTCNPPTGLMVGFVEPGGLIEAEVTKDVSARKIDLYVFLKKVGDNTACPAMGSRFAADQLAQIYKLGSVDVVINEAVVPVEITANFPGLNSNLAQTMSLPASCVTIAGGNKSASRILSAAGVSVGGGMRLIGSVGTVESGGQATGTSMKLKVK